MCVKSYSDQKMLKTKFQKKEHEIIGIIPAGGMASRISPLPCSKEIFPIGFRVLGNGEEARPKVICHYLLEKMKLAQAKKAYIILRQGKWDIPAYLGDGKILEMNLAYLMMGLPYGVPYTVDQAYSFVKDATIVFGFPDILFQPEDAFVSLIQKQKETSANLVLGLFPTDQPQKMDMVDVDHHGKIREIQIKPVQSDLSYTWIIAVWDSVFTGFLHQHLIEIQNKKVTLPLDGLNKAVPELYLGDIFQAAIDNDLFIEHILFPYGSCLDIGTPENLVKAACKQSQHLLISSIEAANNKNEDR